MKPTLRLPDDGGGGGQGVVFSGWVLAPGVWVPQVIRPIIRNHRNDGAVLYGTAREWVFWPPQDPDPETGEAVWTTRREEYSPYTGTGGGLRQVATPTITVGAGTAHHCACGASGPWVLEWVVGALAATARLECRVCWEQEERHPTWVVELVRRLQPLDLPEDVAVDLGPT
ncbi:hypothetical protein [Nocardiopsis sp. L17-MgMaSL7]|uniref:hypothetical protein n=1 Tax=Nocardiopsis sp. L17-MgMaSL7 TaxID=1938893 RepID=UPI000D70AA77|nr:hypothetical protein [Nocardiopsis sp. L17-MgMaSL7]PWV44608.1 hypothetical protein BDW27_12367 [Nocardiopsis sp. L17-MgMaSL7]